MHLQFFSSTITKQVTKAGQVLHLLMTVLVCFLHSHHSVVYDVAYHESDNTRYFRLFVKKGKFLALIYVE